MSGAQPRQRCTPAPKGRAWRKSVHGEVNKLTVQDQTAAVKKLLAERPWLDAARVGVYGHSGGGTNTLNLLFRSPETFQVGAASAPVADMRYYDTIYQERYMGLLPGREEIYRLASPLAHAGGLRGREGKGYAVHRFRLLGRYFLTHLPPGGW